MRPSSDGRDLDIVVSLSTDEIREFLIHALVCSDLRAETFGEDSKIRPEHFGKDRYMANAFIAAKEATAGGKSAPNVRRFAKYFKSLCEAEALDSGLTILAMCGHESETTAKGMDPSVAWEVARHLSQGCFTDGQRAESSYGYSLRNRFVKEKMLRPKLERAIRTIGQSPINDVLEEVQTQIAALDSAGSLGKKLMSRDLDLTTGERIVIPTGITEIDQRYGGDSAGDVNLLAGFSGQGKSILTRQLAVNRALFYQEEAIMTGGELKHAVYLTTEKSNSGPRAQRHITSYLARIDRTFMTEFRGIAPRDYEAPDDRWKDFRLDYPGFSTLGKLKDYEVRMYNRMGTPEEDRLGERERYMQYRGLLGLEGHARRHNLHVLDYTDPESGRFGMSELKADIERIEDIVSGPVSTIYIDQVEPFLEKYLAEQGRTLEKAGRQELKHFPGRCNAYLSGPSDNPTRVIWIIHQLVAPQGGSSYGPHLEPHESWLAECKTMHHYCANALIMGYEGFIPGMTMPDDPLLAKQSPRFHRFSFVKTRDAQVADRSGILIRQSHLNRFDSGSGELVVSREAGNVPQIVRRGDARGFGDGDGGGEGTIPIRDMDRSRLKIKKQGKIDTAAFQSLSGLV